MKRAGGLYILFLLGSSLFGCVTVPREAGFSEVRQNVLQRSGYEVQWYRGLPEDAQVAETIREQLHDTLTLEEAIQIALLNNRRLQAVYEDLGVAQADVVQAGLLRNPVFGGEATFPVSGGVPDLFLSVVTGFLDIFYIPLRKAVANAAFQSARLRVTGAILDLSGQTRAAFYQAQADAQILEMFQQVALSTEASYEASVRMHEAGNITVLERYNEQALYEQARLDLETAEVRMIESRERLNTLMGLWGTNTEWIIEHRLPDLPEPVEDLTDIERQAILTSIELDIARQKIETFAHVLGLTEATALIPEFELGVSAEREEDDWAIGPTTAIAIPIFDQGQARVAAAQAELRRSQAQYSAIAVEIRSAARVIRQRLLRARRTAAHYRDVILPLRSRITEESQRHYNGMQIGVFQLLSAKQQEIEAGRNYILALHTYWVARTGFDLFLQGRMPNLSEPTSFETTMSTSLIDHEGDE